MVNSVSAVNVSRQSTFKPATQAAARPRQALAFKSNDDFDQSKDKTVRNAIIGTVAGLAVLIGGAFALKHGIKGSTVKDAPDAIQNGFLRATKKVSEAIAKPFEKFGGWVKGLFSKKAAEGAADDLGDAAKGAEKAAGDAKGTGVPPAGESAQQAGNAT